VVCNSLTKNGRPCQAMAQKGRRFCFYHDPEKKQERREAAASGGRRGYEKQVCHLLGEGDSDWSFESVEDIRKGYETVVNAYLRGRVLTNALAVLNQCFQGLLKTVQQGRMEDRLDEIERILANQQGVHNGKI